jgi:hypothetical protein
MFQLSAEETSSLRSQIATLKTSRGQHRKHSPYVEETSSLRSQFATLKAGRGQHRKYSPYVFTEHRAIMAATILNSPRSIEMSVYVRAFVQLREMLASNKELARRLAPRRRCDLSDNSGRMFILPHSDAPRCRPQSCVSDRTRSGPS